MKKSIRVSILRLFVISAAVLLSAGCATVGDQALKMREKISCCASPKQFTYESMAQDMKVQLTLDESSPVYGFASGHSYFKSFALPPSSAAKAVRVRSIVTGSTAFETTRLSQLYCPQITFLDANHQVLVTSDAVPTVAGPGSGIGFEFSHSFLAEFSIPAAATYFVLHSNPAGYGRLATRYTGGGGYMVGSTIVISRGGEPIHHPCGPTADAEVSLVK